jgi:excisionase family DNA binding protein
MIGLFQNQQGSGASWDHPYLTREQVADYLQISPRKVSEMTAKGELPAVKLGTGKNASIRYRRTAVDEALSRLGINTAN